MRILIAAAAACTMLAGCSAQQLATVQSDLGTAQAGAVKFCTTDQPVVGVVATVVTAGIAAGVPKAAAAAPITGLIVQDVNGICAGLTAVPVPAPQAGTQVVVPVAAPVSSAPAT
jgi:hypothetical protein